MAASLVTAIGLDQPELDKLKMTVIEDGSADSSFVLSCVIWEWLVGRPSRTSRESGSMLPRIGTPGDAVCLITAHHSLVHYRNVGMKLGYNLATLQQKGVVKVHELNKLISDALHHSSTTTDSIVDKDCNVIVQNLYLEIRKSIEKLLQTSKTVCLVLANISDLLTMGVSVADLVLFVNYLRRLVSEFDGVSLVSSVHVCKTEEGSTILAAALRHATDLTVLVSGLQTGLSKNVTGTLKVVHDSGPNNVYHYRLMDRQVKVFAPGASGM